MAKVIYEIDHAADTVIILENPLTSFAVWNTLKVREDADALYPDRDTVNTPPIHRTSLGTDSGELTVDAVEQLAAGEPLFDTTEEPVIEEPAGHATPIMENIIVPDLSKCPATEGEIHYHVSSWHLRGRVTKPDLQSVFSS
jgi:hypothetical protein